jgi:Ca-activated chloride channel family protein
MTFAHPWLLLLCLAPLLWIVSRWSLSARRLNPFLKALSFVAILAALGEPNITLPQTKIGAVVLVDTSRSITRSDLEHASSIASTVVRHRGNNWVTIVPFASESRAPQPSELRDGVHLLHTSGAAGDATNLESALIESVARIPGGYIPRVVLISDGNENEGSTARALVQLQQLQIPVDTIPLGGRSSTSLRLESVFVPPQAYAGEQIPIDLTVASPESVAAIVTVSAESKDLGRNPIQLQPGTNLIHIHVRLNSAGATAVSGSVDAAKLGVLPFQQAVTLRRAKVLFLSQDPPGTDTNLLQAFDRADLALSRDASLLSGDLSGIQLVVLNNMDLNFFTEEQKQNLEKYVQSGGGLLLIGGERQVYKPDKQLDALDRVLPAKLAPPETPQGTAVALIIDKSSSMEGRKIELARLSAIGVVDHLRPMDTIGVLIFDNSFQWAVPMRRAEDRGLIKRLISGITPDGGTQIAPALTEAYHKVLPSHASYKHIVLLTDGISEEGDSFDLAREAAEHGVTISTVGLGQDVNRSYLERVAAASGGRSYFLNDPQGLEQILLKDVQDYSGATAIEKSLKPIVKEPAEVLEGTDMDNAPPLKGYSRYVANPGAEEVLAVDEQKRDPLYVRWQYGLGRAAVFASDAKSRWADQWVTWPGFDKFWINVSRDLLTRSNRSEASVQYDAADGDILLTYRLAAELPEPRTVPQIFAIGPRGFEQAITVDKVAPRLYQGRINIGRQTGLFRIRPIHESVAFPEIGIYRQQPESNDFGSNEDLLMQIANRTGGRFNPSPSTIFANGSHALYTAWRLWPALLILAIAFTIAELISRKWSGLAQLFRGS